MTDVDWHQGFSKQNPEISLKNPKDTRITRIKVRRKYEFFLDLMYNVDKICISTVPTETSKILGPNTLSACGNYIRPLVVFHRKHMSTQ